MNNEQHTRGNDSLMDRATTVAYLKEVGEKLGNSNIPYLIFALDKDKDVDTFCCLSPEHRRESLTSQQVDDVKYNLSFMLRALINLLSNYGIVGKFITPDRERDGKNALLSLNSPSFDVINDALIKAQEKTQPTDGTI